MYRFQRLEYYTKLSTIALLIVLPVGCAKSPEENSLGRSDAGGQDAGRQDAGGQDASEILLCELPFAAGPCDAAVQVYWYNATTRKCEQREYGGCEGNDNRFESLATCEQTCREPTGETGTAGSSGDGGDTDSTDIVWPPYDLKGCWGYENRRNYADARPFRYVYNEMTRILSQEFVATATENAPTTNALHYRVNEAGWMITYAGDGFRHDHSRDEQHNVTRFEFVYEDWTDLLLPTQASPYMSYDATHTYGEDGLLTETTQTENDDVTTYEYVHDAEGRCAQIQITGTLQRTETRTYVEGRLERVTARISQTDGETSRVVVTTYSYDETERIIAVEQDGGGHWGANADGTPSIVSYWSYETDGRYSVDSRDYTTDTPNDVADGRSCSRVVITYSAGCNALLEQIPVPTSLACNFSPTRKVPLRPWAL